VLGDRPLVACPTDMNGSPLLWVLAAATPVVGSVAWVATGSIWMLTIAVQVGWLWPRLWQTRAVRPGVPWQRCGCGFCINSRRRRWWVDGDEEAVDELRGTLVRRHGRRGDRARGGWYVVELACKDGACIGDGSEPMGRPGWEHSFVHLLGGGLLVCDSREFHWMSRRCSAWIVWHSEALSEPCAQLTVRLAASLPLERAVEAAVAATR